MITIRDDAEWEAFCDAAGHPEWEDERFDDVLGRFENHDELDELITSWTREQDQIEAMHLLQKAGVIAAAVLNPKQVLLDPHLRERGVVRHDRPARCRRAACLAPARREVLGLRAGQRAPRPEAR